MGGFKGELGSIAADEVTLEQAAEWFESIYLPDSNLAERTQAEYYADVMQLIDFLNERGIWRVGEVSLAHLNTFLDTLKKRPSQRRKVFALKTFFQFLKGAELTQQDLATAVIPPPHDEPEPRVLTIQECRALLGACAYRIRDRALIELLLATGVTLSEVVRLAVSDLIMDLYGNNGQLWVQGNGYKRRKLPLDFEVCHALNAWLKIRPTIGDSSLFVTKFDKPLGERSVQNIIQQYLKKARISNASVSSLRHTYAVQELLRGAPLPVLQQRLGLANRQDVIPYVAAAEAVRKLVA
jgi:integrase/recombinase XerD